MAFSLKGILSLDTSGFTKGISDANSSLDGMGKKTQSITSSIAGVAAGAAGFIGLSMGVKNTFDTFVTFEKKMSNVAAISGASADEMKSLSDKAREMGKLLPASASDAADAEAKLASAGFSVNEIMDSLEGTLTLAQSAQVDMATAADITASSLRGFGLEASQAGHVADILAATASRTNAEIVDTGEAMKYVAPVARAAGTSIEETSAMIGLLANAGIKGSQAGTTLRSAFVRFQKPSKEAANVMSEIGFRAYDSVGRMKSMSTIIGELKDKTADMTDEQRDFAIAEIFGTEALSGMKVLMEQGKPAIDALTEGFKEADGVSLNMALKQTDNIYGSLENLKGAVEDMQISMMEKFAPAIKDTFNWMADKVPTVQNEIAFLGVTLIENGDIVLALASVYAAYRAGLILSAGLEYGLAAAVTAKNVVLDLATAAVLGYEVVQGGASVATGVWTAATLALNTVLYANPIGLVIAAIVGLIAIVKLAYDHFEGFKNIVDKSWESLKNWLTMKDRADEASATGAPASAIQGDIPMDANGTSYYNGGMGIVNERGGEMQVMPSGTSIIPADRTRQLLEGNGGGNSSGNNVTINVDARGMDVNELVSQLQLRLANI